MVAISNKYRFVFLKTRKTAGTSIERALFPYCTDVHDDNPLKYSEDRYIPGARRGPAPDGWRPHIPAFRVRRRLGVEKWDAYFRFTAVRNPYDRVVSHFFWMRRNGNADEAESFDETCDAFRRFCKRSRYANDFDIVTVRNKLIVSDAIRYERLDHDLSRIASKLGFDEPIAKLPGLNKGIRKWDNVPIAEFYDDESADAVKRSMNWVFENFGYSEDPRDTHVPDIQP